MKLITSTLQNNLPGASPGRRWGALVVALFLCCGMAFGQGPVNDLCTNAINLPVGTSKAGTTNGATAANVSYCQAQATSPGVWYIVDGNGLPITVSTCGNNTFDTKIGVFSGACGSLYCIGGNDDSPNCAYFASEVTFASEQGSSYMVYVHGFGSTTGNFTISASSSGSAAANATCATAQPITCGSTTSGTTVGGSVASAPTCDGVTVTSPGVWYSFTGSGGPMVLSTCNNTNFDSRISVFTGSCGNFTCAGSNDDFCTVQSKVELSSTVSGQTYYVLVHGFGTEMGNFDLGLTCPVPPANDVPCGATPLVFGSNPLDNNNALADLNEVTPGPGSDPNTCRQQNGWCFFEAEVQTSVWYTVVAPASGCMNILVEGFDVQAALYAVTDCGDYSTYAEVAGNDDSGNLLNPNLPASGPSALVEVACLTPGATYYLQVDGFNGATGQGTITVTDCGNQPLTLTAPSCLNTFTGPGIPKDTTYMVASVSGGFPPYSWDWPQFGTDPTMLYPNETLNGVAVAPTTTTTYTVIVTDSKGCSQSADITVFVEDLTCISNGDTNVAVCYTPDLAAFPVIIDFDSDPFGNSIPSGTIMRNQYAKYGLTITADNARNYHPDEAIIFPSHAPTGRDFDLGTPNERYGGPGRGLGGTLPGSINNVALNNILVIAENVEDRNNDGLVDDPDDEASGGVITFDFEYPVTLHSVKLVDLDDGPGGSVMVCQMNGGGTTSFPVPTIGDNSVVNFNMNISGVDNFQVTYVGSGGVAEISFTPDTTSLCLDPNQVNIDSLVGTPSFGYGTCTSFCGDEAPAWDPPLQCQDLTLTVTGDVFSDFENSWSLTDLNTGVIIDSRDPGFVVPLVTETNVYCVDPTHCYEFIMFDQFGDGFFFGGSYSVDFLGQNVNSTFLDPFGNPLFSESAQLGACGNRITSAENGIAHKAYPNPFTDQTTISFSFPEASDAKVEVYTLSGTKVADLFEGSVNANQTYEVNFAVGDLGSGLYFYRIFNSRGEVKMGKLIIQK